MKRLLASILLLLSIVSVVGPIYASSQQAYQDYLYQFDQYRQKYSDFQVAKNEYAKFKSLAAGSDALDKTKTMMTQRDGLLRAYLLLLNEKLIEDGGLAPTTKQQYQTILRNEITFLENHIQLIPAIGSLGDADTVSKELESHYTVLQISIRQIMIGLSLGQLAILSQSFDAAVKDAQTLVVSYGGVFTPEKQQTLNRWVLQITGKKTLYQQKIDAINQTTAQLSTSDAQELDHRYNEITKSVAEARQYLLEGATFLGELKNALKYID